jgi:hypothetical protein
MVNDLLKLTVDQVFPPKKKFAAYEQSKLHSFPVEGYEDAENMWQFMR